MQSDSLATMTNAPGPMSADDEKDRTLSRVGQRIVDLMRERNLSGRKLAALTDLSPSYISTITSGKTKVPSTKVLMVLQNYFQEDLFGLISSDELDRDAWEKFDRSLVKRNENGQPAFTPGGGITSRADDGALPVVGIVEAGAWRARDEFGDITDEVTPLTRDPRFPLARQEAHLVRGDSMDQAGIFEGGYVRMIAYDDVPLSLRPGTIVILERAAGDFSIFERTVKQVEFVDGEYRFVPRSSNPRHKPVILPQDVDLFDETSEVRVLGFVTAFINPIPY